MEVPNCIGFIMDGNRRWAKEQNLLAFKGHEQGYEKFKNAIKDATDFGVKNLIFYGFSTENWKRTEKEVKYMLNLMEKGFSDLKEIHENKLQIRFIGEREKFSTKLKTLMEDLEEKTKKYKNGLVVIALSYGGRAEIVHAANKILESDEKAPITEENFAKYLWTKDIPDPDLIIRTGEAMRLSNFLPWQSVYSELYFTSTYWPDFNKEEFEYILEDYRNRERRMGK